MQRNQTVEAVRIVAALGIVWFHAKAPGAEYAHGGLTIFVVLALYFEAVRTHHHLVSGLAAKLLVPWAFFMVVYGAKEMALDRPLFDSESLLLGILGGTSPHLWFLPFILAALLLLIGADRLLARRAVAVGAAFGTMGMVLMQHLWAPWSREMGVPIVEYAYALGPALFGVALARTREGGAWVIVPLVISGTGLVANGQWVLLLGAGAVLIAVFMPWRLPVNVEWLSSAMFGVYLVHPLALSVLKPIRDGGWVAPAAIIAFVCSAAVVMVYRAAVRRLNIGATAKVA